MKQITSKIFCLFILVFSCQGFALSLQMTNHVYYEGVEVMTMTEVMTLTWKISDVTSEGYYVYSFNQDNVSSLEVDLITDDALSESRFINNMGVAPDFHGRFIFNLSTGEYTGEINSARGLTGYGINDDNL